MAGEKKSPRFFLRRTSQLVSGKVWYRTDAGWVLIFVGDSEPPLAAVWGDNVRVAASVALEFSDYRMSAAWSDNVRVAASAVLSLDDYLLSAAWSDNVSVSSVATLTFSDFALTAAWTDNVRVAVTISLTGVVDDKDED